MKKLRNEVWYGVACACGDCQRASGRDFEVLGFLSASLKEAQKDLKLRQASHHKSVFLVRETGEPIYQDLNHKETPVTLLKGFEERLDQAVARAVDAVFEKFNLPLNMRLPERAKARTKAKKKKAA